MIGYEQAKDKFGSFLKATAFVFRPYLELKYNPKKNPRLQDRLHSALVYVSSWLIVAVMYVFFVYLVVYKNDQGQSGQLADFLERSPMEIVSSVLHSASVAPVFNGMFLVVLYYAVISFAEKEYLNAIYVHTKISGLLKVVTLGGFDKTGATAEQSENQVIQARKNVHATIADSDKEAISILAPSGYDFFGEGKPLGKRAADASISDKPSVKKFSWKFLKKKLSTDYSYLDNGFILNVVSEKTRTVRILLLDPDGEAVKRRASDYFNHGSHRPVETAEDYKAGIRLSIKNLKEIYTSRKNRNIELKLIDKLPDWKMVLVEGEVWVQPIIPGTRSDHVPIYGFKKGDHSMYYAYFSIFDELWHDPKSKRVDLSDQSV